MYRRIMVALDDSVESRNALPWAMSIAQRAKCSVELVHGVYPPAAGTELYAAAVLDDERRRASERETEDRLRADVAPMISAGIDAHFMILRDASPELLAAHARDKGSDLLIMTTHDRGRLEQFLLGSISESIAHRVELPVLLVHSSTPIPVVTPDAVSIRHLLVPLDGSAFAEQIIPHVAQLASMMEAEVTMLAVVDPILAVAASTSGRDSVVSDGSENTGHVDAFDAEALERAANPLRDAGVSVQIAAVPHRRPATVIVDYAKQHSVDVIAMTTHGRGALKRIVMGSVAHRVLRSTNIPMLIYSPRGRS
jgi:nucleotide-binding universal stress UspA family protein